LGIEGKGKRRGQREERPKRGEKLTSRAADYAVNVIAISQRGAECFHNNGGNTFTAGITVSCRIPHLATSRR
jgi:hypothetical protein